MPTLIIGAAPLTLAQLRAVYERPATIEIAPEAMAAVETGARTIADIVARGEVVYGVNTGFGLLANTRIAPEDLESLQRNLVLSHACGYGPPLTEGVVRLIMVLKLASLVRGASGVKVSTVEALRSLLNHQVYPVIPAKGSVGASGDLAPLAHMSCVLIGEGWAVHDGITLEGWKALALAGLAPLALGPKEGLALLNGTQVSTALALAGLFAAESAFAGGVAAGALSVDALKGSDTPFDPRIHALRGQPGQIDVAMALRTLLANSPIRESHRNDCAKVQDPYSLRCQPQVMGAVLDLLRQSARTLQTEANAVSDNPLVFPETGEVLSGGNFHAEPVAFAADQIAMALCEIGNISERRTAILVDPKMSELPAFLVRQSGLNSGFMIAQVTAAALASENKMLAHPASVDSIPTSANQEDHVSMACHGARRLLEMADNAQAIIGIELLAAAQGLEFHRPMTSSHALESIVADIREQVSGYERDRYFADDIEAAQAQVRLGFFRHYVRGLLPSDDGGLDERRDIFRLSFRGGPLTVAMPHVGRHLPPEVRDGLTELGRQVLDTDWHVDRLYGFLDGGDVTTLIATHSRTVADLNRSPENEALYPGRFETGLTPLADFEGRPLYREGYEPDPTDIARRVERWWRPYHAELTKLIQLAKERHGHALLLDAHSIRAEIPQLFEGRLPDINVGTNDGQSCDRRLTAAVVEVLQAQDRFTWVVDGRFKGGWTTRHYGRPDEGVHAIQFELAQGAYMDEANPTVFDAQRAAPMMELLEKLVAAIRRFEP